MAVELKDPVSAASTANLPPTKAEALKLEGNATLTVDGGAGFGLGTRLLLKAQTAGAQNGVWEVTENETFGGEGTFGGAGNFGEGEGWTLERPDDADTEAEINKGMMVPVSGGETNVRTTWLLTTDDPITVGTTAQTFAALFATPGGTAGGDLDGTYSEPAVVRGGSSEFT